jgi:1,2-phenylacetyl-CoA epoxidase PaaB subunit
VAYEVLARSRRGDPLRHIGTLDAPSDDLARAYARWLYDEESWADVAVVRREYVLAVRGAAETSAS